MDVRVSAVAFWAVEDVALLVCFLVSDKAAYITRQIIQVDGGIIL
jgi:NAD(P)-dependent dehydrogenase (short-subunit alcohol dehydrogenase family)